MMTVQGVDLDLALLRFPLEQFCRAQGGDKSGQHEYLLMCPVCLRPKLSVSIRRRRWQCFLCVKYGPPGPDGKRKAVEGAGGIFKLVQWLGKMDSRSAVKFVLTAAEQAGSDTNLGVGPPPPPETPKIATGLPDKCIAISRQLPYMERRGITVEDARVFGLGMVPLEAGGWLANRIIFPVWEAGKCLYWQARACWDAHEHVPRPWVDRDGNYHDDKFRKSLNPASEREGVRYFGSSDVLLNLEQAKHYPRVAIVEGPTSCIRTGPDAVATFGKQLHPAQVSKLIQAGVKAVDFMWDGPKGKEPMGAWPEMQQAAAMLAPHMDVRMVYLPSGDPGDWPRHQLNQMRLQAQPYLPGGFLP